MADEVLVELPVEWATKDEGPVPTRAEALAVARERTAMLVEALGDLVDLDGRVLDVAYRARRRRDRAGREWLKPDGGNNWEGLL